MQRCCCLQGSSIHHLGLRPQEVLGPIRWSCNSTTGSILVLETSGEIEVGHTGWHVGKHRPCGSGRDKSSPEDGNHHQNPPSMVEAASSAPAFLEALCRPCSPRANYHHSLDLTPHELPISQDRPFKAVTEAQGLFSILLQGSGAVSSLTTRTWFQPSLSWQNHAQESMLNLKAKCQHPKLVV